MKKNFTEFIVRIYHYKSESYVPPAILRWVRSRLKGCLGYRKITVKKHKRLNKEKIVKTMMKWAEEQEAVDKFGEITLSPDYDDLKNIAKAIY